MSVLADFAYTLHPFFCSNQCLRSSTILIHLLTFQSSLFASMFHVITRSRITVVDSTASLFIAVILHSFSYTTTAFWLLVVVPCLCFADL